LRGLRIAGLATFACAVAGGQVLAEGPSLDDELRGDVDVTGMTFVASRGETSELVLRAREATFHPDTNVAELGGVRATAVDSERGHDFTVSCARGELDVDTNDFLAEGDVRGTTGDGQDYSAPWVRYDHAEGLLYTDAPVVMHDASGSFEGDGFRYVLSERRFRLLGNVRVVQAP
jgi:LPS export ABC transporter protein LptC